MAAMEERPPMEPREDEIDLGKYFAILRKEWWKILLFSILVGGVTLLWMMQQPNIYRATATVTPAGEESRPSQTIGALASLGVSVGGPSRLEDVETLFKSNDLTARVFGKYNIWPALLPDSYDATTGKLKMNRMAGSLGGNTEMRAPSDWDAIRHAKGALFVSVQKKSGTITLSFEARSPEAAAGIVKYYLEEAKSRLQEEALERAARNKKFIQEQIGKTVDALTRDRLYTLYGQEVEREMLARNREQFGFRVIDSPRIPDRKSKPARARTAITVTLGAFLAACGFSLIRRRSWREEGRM